MECKRRLTDKQIATLASIATPISSNEKECTGYRYDDRDFSLEVTLNYYRLSHHSQNTHLAVIITDSDTLTIDTESTDKLVSAIEDSLSTSIHLDKRIADAIDRISNLSNNKG